MPLSASCEVRSRARVIAIALGLGISFAASVAVAADEPAADEPAAMLARARAVMGFSRAGSAVIHYRAVAAQDQDYESDRSYPPFFAMMQVKETWFDPVSGVAQVTTTRATYPSSELPPSTMVSDARRAFSVTADPPRALGPLPLSALRNSRYLDPWPVVADWSAASDVRISGREVYRDYPRVVLVRAAPGGEQRLFIDPKSGFPIKLELVAPHYLWGQQRVEYLYSNWIRVGAVMTAGASFALVDGQPRTRQTVGAVDLVARTAAALPVLPDKPGQSAEELPRFLQPIDLTTVQVGPSTYLLSNPGYTEAVTRVGDEVFVLDATQGEQRVDKVAHAIARLFPGARKVTVVVTDLAWPHVAGVRAWIARGATIVTHRAGQAFLHEVIDRRWTLAPDLLERRRNAVSVQIRGIEAATPLAGGALTLHPIDGVGSEVAVMAYVAADRFLWASDYLQPPSGFASAYAAEVVSAVRREGLAPARAAAQHHALTAWSAIEAQASP